MVTAIRSGVKRESTSGVHARGALLRGRVPHREDRCEPRGPFFVLGGLNEKIVVTGKGYRVESISFETNQLKKFQMLLLWLMELRS